MSRFAARSGKN